MDCRKTVIDDRNSFLYKYIQHNQEIMQFFKYNVNDQESFNLRNKLISNGREKELANVIEMYMSDLEMTNKQVENLKYLRSGHKVIIGGQQAGLFTGPLYTFHKMMSVIILANEQTEKLNKKVVPIFWIAGEDHDFDEVNHINAYNRITRSLNKIKYETSAPPEKSVSDYTFKKEEVKKALDELFNTIGETEHSHGLKKLIENIIDGSNDWSTMFKKLSHEVFKDAGLLFIDAHNKQLRMMERDFLKTIIDSHEKIDESFRETQEKFKNIIKNKMILTDTNVHLFYSYNDKRQLINYKDGEYFLSKEKNVSFTKEELKDLIDKHPERFSNNVVTRPLMQEYLFNTLAFVGGPSELIYWGELSGVFNLLEIEMPVVVPRMRMSYLTQETKKVIEQYQLDLKEILISGVKHSKEKFILDKASEEVLKEIDLMKEKQFDFHQKMIKEIGDDYQNRILIEKNNKIHQHQYQYLRERYLLNVERTNDVSMKHFNIVQNNLYPFSGLQERVWNPIQFMNQYGKNIFLHITNESLHYTFKHITIEI